MQKVNPIAEAANTPANLWRAFCTHGGLDIKKRTDGREAHDAELVEAVRGKLGLPAGTELGEALEQSDVTIEDVLNAILGSIVPWARMMQDTLKMLEEAGSQDGTENLEINLEWGALNEDVKVSVNAFRRHVEVIQQALVTGSGREWGKLNFQRLYPLDNRITAELKAMKETLLDLEEYDHVAPDLRNWVDSIRGGSTDFPPFIRLDSDPQYAALLAELRSAVVSHLRAVALIGGGRYAEMTNAPEDLPLADAWSVPIARHLHSDYFTAWTLIRYAAAPRHRDWLTGRNTCLTHLRETLAQVSRRDNHRTEAARALGDVVDLPLWKERHELYSIWVATQIASFSGHTPQWILAGGTLSFSFGGADVARFRLAGGTALLRAESRAKTHLPLKGKGRKHGIQPDYTVYREHASERLEAGLVVECKHYRVAARKSFEEALSDYASVHSEASILLVNYTQIGEITLPKCMNFCGAYGEMRPSGLGVASFQEQVKHAFCIMDAYSEVLGRRATIQLHWSDGGDLDLHVVRRRNGKATTICFSSPGSLAGDPWMELKYDHQCAPATEVVSIHSAMGDVFEIYVHRYSGHWPTSGFYVDVSSGHGVKRISPPPTLEEQSWWHVCDARIDKGVMSLGTGMHMDCPY